MTTQTIRVEKTTSKRQANKYVKDHGYKVTPPGPNNPQYKHYYSFRQRQPSEFVKGSMRTKVLRKENPKIFIVYGTLKK